jgi:ribosomal protein L37E
MAGNKEEVVCKMCGLDQDEPANGICMFCGYPVKGDEGGDQ